MYKLFSGTFMFAKDPEKHYLAANYLMDLVIVAKELFLSFVSHAFKSGHLNHK